MARLVLFADAFGQEHFDRLGLKNIEVQVVVDPKRGKASEGSWSHPPPGSRKEFVAQIQSERFQLGLVFSYSRLLWKELIDCFPLGVVNLHFGKLPEYRGANPIQWALINGEKESGVTLHYVDEGVDTGPIIGLETVPILRTETALSLREKKAAVGMALLKTWIPRLIQEKVVARPQDSRVAKHWSKRKPEDGRVTKETPSEVIERMSRALVKPWPGIWYMNRQEEKIVIDRPVSAHEADQIRRDLL